MRARILLTWLALAAYVPALPAFAQEQPAVVQETEEDRRVREISQQLRCAVCQNESVADSGSTLARNMRAVVREQVQSGKSDTEIKAYFVERYGDYILMEPRRQGLNWLLWAFPFAALLAGILFISLRYARRGQSTTAPVPTAQADAANSDDTLIAALRRPSSDTPEKE